MATKHRALIIGAGRIGAGYQWHDDAYTHAGAYRALKGRVELVGICEKDEARRLAAHKKWNVPCFEDVRYGILNLKPDIASICVQPEHQQEAIDGIAYNVKALWCEKPYVSRAAIPVQVGYMRRGDARHRSIMNHEPGGRLIVYGKDDVTTRCHFDDLAKFWRCKLEYRPFNGPCAYVYEGPRETYWFDNGGVDGGTCFQNMLSNLLDHLDFGKPLWSPAT